MPPAQLEGLAQQPGVAVVAFRRESRGVDDQDGVGLLGRRQLRPAVPVDAAVAAGLIFAHCRGSVEKLGQGLHDEMQEVAALLVARVVAAVEQQGQSVDGRGLEGVAPGGLVADGRQELAEGGVGDGGGPLPDRPVELLPGLVLTEQRSPGAPPRSLPRGSIASTVPFQGR